MTNSKQSESKQNTQGKHDDETDIKSSGKSGGSSNGSTSSQNNSDGNKSKSGTDKQGSAHKGHQ